MISTVEALDCSTSSPSWYHRKGKEKSMKNMQTNTKE